MEILFQFPLLFSLNNLHPLEHLTFSLNCICSALGLASAGFTRYIVPAV